ncbi:MAG: hypothetical protein ACFFA6_10600 [Promethearchaeota archaeon]
MINEMDYYLNLIDEFYFYKDKYQRELWKDEKIIELMRISKDIKNNKFLQNTLIFLMSLFNDHFVDTYECESKVIGDLLNSEKEILLSTLRVEVI